MRVVSPASFCTHARICGDGDPSALAVGVAVSATATCWPNPAWVKLAGLVTTTKLAEVIGRESGAAAGPLTRPDADLAPAVAWAALLTAEDTPSAGETGDELVEPPDR